MREYSNINLYLSGSPYINANGVQQVCDVTLQIDDCPRGYWCNPGGDSLTTLCCPGGKYLSKSENKRPWFSYHCEPAISHF